MTASPMARLDSTFNASVRSLCLLLQPPAPLQCLHVACSTPRAWAVASSVASGLGREHSDRQIGWIG